MAESSLFRPLFICHCHCRPPPPPPLLPPPLPPLPPLPLLLLLLLLLQLNPVLRCGSPYSLSSSSLYLSHRLLPPTRLLLLRRRQ
jgi:hypothetical protein